MILPPVAWMALLFFLSHQPDLPGPGMIPDKVYHFGAYAVLGALLLRAFHGGRYPLRAVPATAAVFVTVLYGAGDEYHQSFVDGRDPSGADLIADAVGALAAVVAAWVWQRIFRRK